MNRTVFFALVKRNVKMFFRDKGMFLVSLITPLILLLLYVTFLGNVYRDAFTSALPGGLTLPDKLINGCVSAQLVSSVLSVSAVTVAFCSNMLMVQDRANGTIWDLTVTPVNPGILGGAYFTATFISTLLINLIAAVGGLVYMGVAGWYMSAYDVVLLLCDIVLTVLFGTAASSVVNFFLSGSDICCGNCGKLLLWLCLRGVYADIQLFGRAEERHIRASRDLRYLADTHTFHGRRFQRDGGHRSSRGVHLGNEGRGGQQDILFRKRR